jgi:GTPase SAR1 family protein
MAKPTPAVDVWSTLVTAAPFTPADFGSGDPHLLFVGGEKSGKTSLQNIFLSRNEDPVPTLALTYQNVTIKASSRSMTLHFWELGGGLQLDSILNTIVTPQTQPGFLIFVCFDLMSPASIVDAVEWLDRVQSRFGDNRRSVFMIGTRYDIYESRDPREKDLLVQGLRAIAAQHGAGIAFISNRTDSLMNRFKNIIKYVALANSKIKEKMVESNSPIIIGPGEDEAARANSEAIATMMNQISQDAANEREKSPKDAVNPAEDKQFVEEEIDSLRAARRDELAQKLKQ